MIVLRTLISLFFFLLFGIGAFLISLFILPFIRRRETALRLVRALWTLLVKGFIWTGLIAVENKITHHIRGRIIVANHPSLIDVVLLTVWIPKTFSAAKPQLTKNLFLRQIVKKCFLPTDEHFLDEAKKVLRAGYNILIFPEGTRTPPEKKIGPLKRGTAHLALRTGAKIQPIQIHLHPRVLAKSQPLGYVAGEKAHYSFLSCKPILPPRTRSVPESILARRLTEEIMRSLTPPTDDTPHTEQSRLNSRD